MNQNKRSGEETGRENQSSGEETAEYQSSSEEDSKKQSSGEETAKYQSSSEEDSEKQSIDDDKDEWVEEEKRCVVSDPARPHYLSRRNGYKTNQGCFSCGKRSTLLDGFYESDAKKNFHYYCAICKVEFHPQCRRMPSKIIHPYHPQHPLTFTFLHKKTGRIANANYNDFKKFRIIWFSKQEKFKKFYKTFETLSGSSLMFDKCTWCANNLSQWFYRCLICNFSLDRHCIFKNPPLTIQTPKSHHHSLSLFPRPVSFPCNACGLTDVKEPGYACYQCNYFVHQFCVDLPRVIKITRHPHQLFHTPFLPTKVSTCRVCYKNIDIKYGQYSCEHVDCSFVVHSKCATHKRVWDGKEFEWELEEPEVVVAPYKKIGGGLIEHFSHHYHYLKLEKYEGTRDSRKKCQACMRSILSSPDDFYNCVECEFFLHEECANLPRKLDHGLHMHSLFLDPFPPLHSWMTYCNVCKRMCSCWKYRCKTEGCIEKEFMMDVNCILVPECFTHGSHAEHLMFVSITYGSFDGTRCQGCKDLLFGCRLQCTECEFVLCYKCATIPDKLCCKYYEHPLSLCYGESGDVGGMYWCEVCEKMLDPKEWFYTDTEYCTTIHVECVFGDSALVKFGLTYDYGSMHTVKALSNTISRPTCYKCRRRCPHPVYFKLCTAYETVIDFCSSRCLRSLAIN